MTAPTVPNIPDPTFDFSSFPELRTDRLKLRDLRSDDAEALSALHRAPDVMRFLNHEPADTVEKAHDVLAWFQEAYLRREAIHWAITLRGAITLRETTPLEQDHLIGMCGVYNWDRSNRRVDLGYILHPDHWNRGFVTEATRAITRWSFEALALHRVQADCTEGNFGSARVLLKCGFKHEGTWRENTWEHGRFVNIQQFGVLRHEFLGTGEA